MKVGMVSLGCPKNQVDAEVMAGLIRQAGHTITSDEGEAEAIIVNTCAFISDATEESIAAVLEMAELKEKGRLKYLITAGCLSQRYKSGLIKELPEVDAYLGTGEFDRVASVLDGLIKGRRLGYADSFKAPQYLYSHDTPRIRFTPHHWAYLKVSEGCDNRCSYCVIPSMRGDLRSRPQASIVEEARMLVSEGVKEICVIAQDTTAYGTDRKPKASLTGLLAKLERIKGLGWVRILYSHPAHITDELVEFMAGSSKVVSYLDMPIQHIDDDILSRMGRKVKSDDIRRLMDRTRAKVPDMAFRTSLLTGFPGETKEKFARLLKFVKEAEFDHVGVFAYSDEEGTRSFEMDGKVSSELAHERRDTIMKAQSKISLKKNKARVGNTYRVLVDGPSPESNLLVAGRAYFQAPEIDGVIYITDGDFAIGDFVDVLTTEAHPYDLVGRAV